MAFFDWFLGKSEEQVTDQNALQWLKDNGYWEPLPGTKAVSNPKLFFAYADAIAFAVDADSKAVHVIYAEQDVSLYTDPGECEKAIRAGYASPELRGRKFIVVRKRAG